MHRWSAVVAISIVMALSAGAIASAPTHETGPLPAAMLASDGMLPAAVHDGGHGAVAAYRAAIDHPEVLASVPCTCGCIQTLGHMSNLACYVESRTGGVTRYTSHGVSCLICQQITEDALAGAAAGMQPAELRAMIVAKYGR